MGSNMQGSSQGNYDPTQPRIPPTQYGSSNPYLPMYPYAPPPPKNNRPLIIGLIVVIGALVLTLVGVIAFVLGSQRGTPQQNLPLAVKDPTAASNVTPTSALASTATPIPPPSPTPIPTAIPTPTPTPLPTQGSSPTSEPRPKSASEIAGKLGGDASSWSPLDPYGWVYRGGPETNSFIVPHWCVVDTPQGRLYPGQQVQPQVALTIYYNVSRYDLAGHNP